LPGCDGVLMRRIPLVLFCSMCLLAFASCGGGDDSSSETVSESADSDDSGSRTVDVPSGFAIPAPDGPEIVIDSLPGIPEGSYLQLFYAGDRLEEILSFYESWVNEQPFEWSPPPDDRTLGAAWVSLSLEGEPGYGQSVIIAPATDSVETVSVTLVASVDG
ncbi:MAG: hypothetical protein ACR2P0_12100, partial [Acidimicrobiales bacterium]